jgi:hypothetical protein
MASSDSNALSNSKGPRSSQFNRREFLETTLVTADVASLAAGTQLAGGPFETAAAADTSLAPTGGWRKIEWGDDHTFAHRQDAVAMLYKRARYENLRTSNKPPDDFTADRLKRLANDFRWKKLSDRHSDTM